jgi:hypothetical protein
VPTPDLLQTAVRAFTLRTAKATPLDPDPEDPGAEDDEPEPATPRCPRRTYAREALVWDTETVVTPDQRLMVLCWRVYDLSLGEAACIEEGFAYPDDLGEWDPQGLATLAEYAGGHEWAARPGVSRMPGGRTILVEPLSWWLEKRLYRLGYDHRHRCDVVGFNLPFDFGRVAAYWGAGQDRFYGGWSLGLWGRFDPVGKWHDRKHQRRLRLKSIDPRRSLIAWGSGSKAKTEEERPWDWWKGVGRFVDLRTLAFALTDKGHSLESACKAFGVPYAKQDVEHGNITPKLLSYAREDVAATADLYFACRAELDRHEGIALQPHKLYSPATIGANYLQAMGYRRPLEKFTDIEPWQLGWETEPATPMHTKTKPGSKPAQTDWPSTLGRSMCAFYGGRAEARIVRTPVPVALVDFTSMYPSVNALLDTRSLLNAESIKTINVTESIQTLLGPEDLVNRCYDPAFWRDQIGVTLVEVEPAGDVLPIRAQYDPTGGDLGIGVNPYHLDRPVWYALPDVIAATILTGQTPHVNQAVRLVGVGEQEGLRPVKLRGGLELDPRIRDPFITMIEERQRVRKDATIPDDEREWRQLFLKVTANSTAYGVLARFDRKEGASPVEVAAYGPDPDPIPAKTKSPEDPGPYCFPPIAATITAAARLMLALLEHAATSQGGTYAFCDTDSMAIVTSSTKDTIRCPSPDGTNTIHPLTPGQVQAILDRFTSLNPYDPTLVPGSPWKVEHQSLEHELWCYAISAKRYALYHPTADGGIDLVAVADNPEEDTPPESDSPAEDALADWSEHGLGLYLDPTTTDPDKSPRDQSGRRVWVRQAWEWILTDAVGQPTTLPDWCIRYALTRFTVSGQRTLDWFSGYNATRERTHQIRPGSFGLIGHPQPGFQPNQGPLPAAPYEPNPENWPTLAWYDRRTSNPIQVTTLDPTSPEHRAHQLQTGAIPIQTLRDVLTRYRLRPEHKSIAPDNTPASRDSTGLLQRRPVRSARELLELTGKEGNKLLERATGEYLDPDEYQNTYATLGDPWDTTVNAVRLLGAARVAAQAGIDRGTVQRTIRPAAPTTPHPSTRQKITEAAARLAATQLTDRGLDAPTESRPTLHRYLELAESGSVKPICACGCGLALPPGRRKWYSEAHRRQPADRR